MTPLTPQSSSAAARPQANFFSPAQFFTDSNRIRGGRSNSPSAILKIQFVLGSLLVALQFPSLLHQASSVSSDAASARSTPLSSTPQDIVPVEFSRPAAAPPKKKKQKPKKWCQLHSLDRRLQRKILPCEGCTSISTQDQVLEGIFETIGTTNRHCVQFGFGGVGHRGQQQQTAAATSATNVDTKKLLYGLNTHRWIHMYGWNYTLVDAFSPPNPQINLHQVELNRTTIAQEFRNASIPEEVDFMSIDIESVDVWMLVGLLQGGYRPRVISIGYNPNIPPEILLSHEDAWSPQSDSSRIYGASAGVIHTVAMTFGYMVVEIIPLLDMFLVRHDILHATCELGSVPSFEHLAVNRTGQLTQPRCPAIHLERWVKFALEVERKTLLARVGGTRLVEYVNAFYHRQGAPKFCPA